MSNIIIPNRKLESILRPQPCKILKLPCGHSSVEIKKPEDQMVYCGICKKHFYLTWATRDVAKKVKEIEIRKR